MATPHVTGVVALVKSLHPTWTASQVISQVLGSVDPIPALVGKTVTGGRLNAAKAVGWQAPPSAPGVASFVGTHVTVSGSWQGQFGSQGYDVSQFGISFPSYAQVSISGASSATWAASTTDSRALLKPGSTTDRIAATWYNGNSFIADVNLTDGQTHGVSLY